jgi:LPS sulfotransferase NodH
VAPADRRNLLILSAGRSGSTLLVNYLNSHPRIYCRGEILNSGTKIYGCLEGKSRERLLLHIRSYYRQRRGQYVGAKFHTHQFDELALPLRDVVEALHQPKVIVLYRENLLETYVSLQIARGNNLWCSDSVVNHEAIRVDWHDFLRYAAHERARWENCLAAVVGSCATHTLTFEEMVGDPQKALDGVFAFLGLPTCPVTTRTIRQNPQPLSDKIVNYAELPINDFALPPAMQLSLRAEPAPAAEPVCVG